MDAIPQNGREQEKVQSLHVEQCPDITNTGDPMMDGGVHDQFIHRNIVTPAGSSPETHLSQDENNTDTFFLLGQRRQREKEEEGLS